MRPARRLTVEEGRALFAVPSASPVGRVPRAWRGLEESVEALLTLHGWRWIHIRPARRTNDRWQSPYTGYGGYFDYTAMRAGVILFLEVKDGAGRLSADERVWAGEAEAAARLAATVQYVVVRRADVDSGRLENLLRGRVDNG